MDAPPVLLGTLTRLRPWTADDAEAIRTACQDADIQRFTTVPSPYRREDAEWFVAHYPAHVAAQGGAAFCVEGLDTPGRVAASLTLLHVRDGVGEVGYWTAPWARRRGLLTDALGTLAAWSFARGDVDALELVIETANVASRAVARRAGFVEVRHEPTRTLADGSVRDMRIGMLRATDRTDRAPGGTPGS